MKIKKLSNKKKEIGIRLVLSIIISSLIVGSIMALEMQFDRDAIIGYCFFYFVTFYVFFKCDILKINKRVKW